MAEALGWPTQPLGWSDIAEITRAGATWSTYGHPEWGKFLWGHTHPEYSNSGIMTIVALAYAGANKTRDLSPADLRQTNLISFMSSEERSVIHYGESTGFMANTMFLHGPAYLSAAAPY